MNLLELQKEVEKAIAYAKDCEINPESVEVSLQIDFCDENKESVFSSKEVGLYYDNNGCASGCVLTADI